MHLSPHEQERLLLLYAAELARRRQARGLRLDLPEATAIVTDHLLEGARDGVLVAELMQSGRTVLTPGRRDGRRPRASFTRFVDTGCPTRPVPE